MDYTFKITNLVVDEDPVKSFIQVEYSAEGREPVLYQTYIPKVREGHEQEDIEAFARTHSDYAISQWHRQDIDAAAASDYQETINSINVSAVTLNSPVNATTAIAPSEDTALQEQIAREQRFWLLAETDWMFTSDTPEISQAWLDYRQALRDIPSQAGFPTNIEWPTKPE